MAVGDHLGKAVPVGLRRQRHAEALPASGRELKAARDQIASAQVNGVEDPCTEGRHRIDAGLVRDHRLLERLHGAGVELVLELENDLLGLRAIDADALSETKARKRELHRLGEPLGLDVPATIAELALVGVGAHSAYSRRAKM